MTAVRAPGNFFEDFSVGQKLAHAGGRTITEGDCAVYLSLTGDRYRLFCDAEYAKRRGYRGMLVNDLLVFHVVFGQTVADISRNAVANLGYADVRFRNPVYVGDTLTTESEVIGVRQNKNGKSGIVYVQSRGKNQSGQTVLEFYRWVMVRKRDEVSPAPNEDVPNLPDKISPFALVHCAETVPASAGAAGPGRYFEDYKDGQRVYHGAGMTIEEAEHASATRLYQNTAAVHFDGHALHQAGGRRLVYGGHVISIARALQYDGMENAERILGWNSGTHSNSTHAGDTLYAVTDVLEKHTTFAKQGGILRLRLWAVKNHDPLHDGFEFHTTDDHGKVTYHPDIVLDLDYYAFVPNRTSASQK